MTGVICAVGLATGWYGLFYLGLTLVVAIISMHLFARKSALSKLAAVVMNTDLIYKILMPRKYRKAIRDLRDKESAK